MEKFEIKDHEHSLLPEGKNWELAWSDEFDGDTLDESKWMYRTNFWGKPFSAYCDKGVSLDGKSNAVFRPVRMEDGRICSAQLQTGSNSFDIPKYAVSEKANAEGGNNFWPLGSLPEPKFMHSYGYYEVRCKLQKTDGWWSAFWLQSPSIGTTYNPEWSGVEVDIMEHFEKDVITSGNIYGGYGRDVQESARKYYPIKNLDDYHRFGVLWAENEYVFYCDGEETARSNTPISKVPQFILLSTEVQGYRRGDRTRHEEKAEKCIGDEFVVDYVRVFNEVKK